MDTSSRRALPENLLLAPRVMLEAGNERLQTLAVLLRRCLDEMAPGHVVEVVSSEPSTCTALPGWCTGEGFTVLHMITDQDQTRFWIHKVPPDPRARDEDTS